MSQLRSVADYIRGNRPYFENFITRSTYNSNRIEGNTLSFAETYAIIFNDNAFKVNATPREIFEAVNHKYALNYLFDHTDEPLSTSFLQRLGREINRNILDIDGFRKVQVYIRGANFVPPPPSQVPARIMYFVDNYNNSAYPPFEKAARFHVEYEHIHPFEDGNGRTGRLLLNYEMIRQNLPLIVIPADDRAGYFDLLQREDIPGLTQMLEACSNKEKEYMEQFLEGFEQPAGCPPEQEDPSEDEPEL